MITLEIEKKSLENIVLNYKSKVEEVIIKNLSYIGETCINLARNLGSEYRGLNAEELEEIRHKPHQPNYIDLTGNLRNSLGYLVAVDGNVVSSSFFSQNGETFAKKVLSKYQSGFCLIMVAGMEYAVELTFEKGYDVLESAVLEAKVKYLKFVENLKNNFK